MPSSRARLAQQWCSLVLFGHTISDFLDDPCTRDHHVVELWSGVGSIVLAACQEGLTAVPFDKWRGSGETEVAEDILTRDGFFRAVQYVLRLVVGGLLWMAPVCSSFVFMNCSNCKRNEANKWKGDMTYQPVIDGNLGAEIACFLFWLAWARDVEVGMENPSRSDFWKYPCIKDLCVQVLPSSALSNRCAWDTRPFGKRLLKQYKFVATGEWIQQTARKCRCPDNKHQELVRTSESGAVSGIADQLQASAAYPRRLGRGIVDAWNSRFPGSEMGSGVQVHRPSARTQHQQWLCESSDDSRDDHHKPEASHQALDSKKRSQKSSSWMHGSSSDESAPPAKRSSSSWMRAASDSE